MKKAGQAGMGSQLPAATMKRIVKELVGLTTDSPCEGIRVEFSEENLTEVHAEFDGPTGTPYEGGVFKMKLLLGGDFPASPPKGYFLTKTFHPNISENGEICVNVLKKDWRPELGVRHVLLIVRCLLIEPFAESALNEEAGRALLEDYELFCRQAKLMTLIHAMPAKRPMPLTARTGSDVSTPLNSPGKAPTDCDLGSPAMKKAKGDAKACTAKRRALKRL